MVGEKRGPGLRRRSGGVLAGGVLAGAVGTAAMTVTGRAHRLVVARRRGVPRTELTELLDYDDSDHVVVASGAVTRAVTGWAPRTPAERRALFLLTHWGYGSAVGAAHAELRRLLDEPAAGVLFFVGCQTMALGLFPVLGGTPVPWRWESGLLVTSFAQHLVYAAGVTATNIALGHVRR